MGASYWPCDEEHIPQDSPQPPASSNIQENVFSWRTSPITLSIMEFLLYFLTEPSFSPCQLSPFIIVHWTLDDSSSLSSPLVLAFVSFQQSHFSRWQLKECKAVWGVVASGDRMPLEIWAQLPWLQRSCFPSSGYQWTCLHSTGFCRSLLLSIK